MFRLAHRTCCCAFLFAAVVVPPSVNAADVLVLANGPDAVCPIVLPDSASEAERYAGRELSEYLHKICDARFPVTNAAPAGMPSIVMAHDSDLGPESYRLVGDASSKRLLIEGGRPRGVLYGVYGLLEEHLGCRWFTREVQHVPHSDRLAVPANFREQRSPRLEYREVFWTEAFDGDWAARNRMNSSNARLETRHGGRVRYGTFVHTFDRILPVAEYFETHPEYFSLVNGTRRRKHTQLCLTNPDVLQHAIRTVRAWIAAYPDATIFSVSQNDWLNPCECAGCKAIDDAEGSHAGSLLTFVNAVADAIAKEHPGIAIDTLAYQYTRKPPRTLRPRPNVIVRLCSIESCFAHPLDGCPEATNRSFMEDLRGWEKLSKRLYIWDYTTDFAYYLLPFPNLDVLDDNIRTFATHGVAGVFEQGNYSAGGGGELAEVRSWMLAKLLWNPDLDGGTLLREFVEGVYGPAAPAVHRYFDLRHETARDAGNHVRIFDGPRRKDLPADRLLAWNTALEEAEQLAGADAMLRRRVVRLRIPVWYALVAAGHASGDVLQLAASRLAAAATSEKITNFREHGHGIEDDLRKLELIAKRRTWIPPPGAVAIEDQQFRLYREGDLVQIVADATAGDGLTARLEGRTREWAVQWQATEDADIPATPCHVLARIRIEKTADTGFAFHAGLYNATARRGMGEIRIAASNVIDAAYHDYDLGLFDPAVRPYAYIAPDDNVAAVPAIFIDRLLLVPLH